MEAETREVIPSPPDPYFYYQFLGRNRQFRPTNEVDLMNDDRPVLVTVQFPDGDGGLPEGGEGFPI